MILKLILGFCWYLLHLMVNLRHMGSSVNDLLFCYIISMGLLLKHQNLQLDKLNSLAVVVDSEEAKNTTKIKQLLCWLSSIGIKYIILYDMQGKHAYMKSYLKWHSVPHLLLLLIIMFTCKIT